MASDEGGKTYYFEDVVNAGKDTGYSENNEITKNDPHYGWKLGSFSISGYTQEIINTDGTVTFLKTVGDEVALSFQLNQNIDKLNDKDNLVIADDKNGDESLKNLEKIGEERIGKYLIVTVKNNNEKNVQIFGKFNLYKNGNLQKAYDNELATIKVGDAQKLAFNVKMWNMMPTR